MRFSVAMATYNGAAFLEEQLASIAAQTLPPSEIVICDDGSRDGTPDLARAFAARTDVVVRVYENEVNLGFRRNFIKAARLCEGDIVAFCDQDDIWLPHKLAALAAEFRDPELMAVVHEAEVMDRSGAVLGRLLNIAESVRSPPLGQSPWQIHYGFAIAFRRALLDHAHLAEELMDAYAEAETISHDQWAIMLASSLGRTLLLAEPLARYRQHDANTVGWHPVEPLSSRVRYWLDDRSESYAHCAAAAAQRGALFRAEASCGRHAEKMLAAAEAYEELAGSYERRVALYRGASLWGRARGAYRLWRRGAYSERSTFTFGRNGLVKDLALGVLGGSWLRRFGTLAEKIGDPSCRPGRARAAAVDQVRSA